jgi:alanine-glyoxylate transaminase/serine-glyoxylate transaminase/serine-pyruvate transaminase
MAVSKLQIPTRLLYGPGPSAIDPRVCQAMSGPALGIRDPYFLRIMGEVSAGLRTVFGTTNRHTFPIPAGGSAGMEAAVSNFTTPGSRLGVFAAGHFADRLCTMAERHGVRVARFEKPWGEVFAEDEVREFVERERPDNLAFIQAETSTGAYQSGRAIASAAKLIDGLVIADAVTSLGAMPVQMDEVGFDVSFSCTQKGLSGPAGLSPISISERAWQRLANRATAPAAWYLDLKLMDAYFTPPHTYHHTPSPPLYYALHEALRVIEEEGLEQRLERHRSAGEQLREGLEALGFQYLVTNPQDRTWHLAVVKPPAGVDEALLRERLLDRDGIEIAGGLGRLAGKVLRIGVMGPLANPDSVAHLLHAIKRCL